MNRFEKFILSVLLAGGAYSAAVIFGHLGFALAGAGHGSGIFGYLFYSPVIGYPGAHISLGLYFWPIIGVLLPWSKRLSICCLIVILLGLTYYGINHDMRQDIQQEGTTSYANKVMEEMPETVSMLISVFALGQITIIGTLLYFQMSKLFRRLNKRTIATTSANPSSAR